ncbi:hypothetical protein [Nocardia sp. JMUB6875]|uniref:hypothetical protein n=1 Tax=Nocardia sp. JMUB6875 TaxID=3158170 RepID=UPI0034E8DE84
MVEVELLRRFTPEQYQYALQSWVWIGVEGLAPVFTSPFGDVFFIAKDGVWYLDVFWGKITREWESLDECNAELQTAAGQDDYLRAMLAVTAAKQGLHPNDSEIYDLGHPVVLGGAEDAANVRVMDFVTAVGMAGQIHDQVRFIPAGAPINVSFQDPDGEPPRPTGWRRWFGRN